ncbi:MAG: hypothetical protein ACI4MS_02200 [Candidatus Coproplasma sp.]
MSITIYKNDIKKNIYFIVEMVQNAGEKGMYGGLAGKSDFIGGIFDRWINQIPESVIFNKHLLNDISHGKNVEVIIDFYKYNPRQETTGIAPDVIGLKINNTVVPFAVYDKKWKAVEGKPQIEVKTFKSTQKMVSLRDQGYDGKYLVMVDTTFRTDYLLPFFDESFFSDSVYDSITMNDSVFLKHENEYIHHIEKVDNTRDDLGTIDLICVIKTESFKSLANYCDKGVSPVRIDSISGPIKRKISQTENTKFSELCDKRTILYRFNKNWYPCAHRQYLDFYCSDISAITCIKRNKGSAYIKVERDCCLNTTHLNADSVYKIVFTELNRGGADFGEYFMQKDIIGKIPNKEDELKDILSKIIQEEK